MSDPQPVPGKKTPPRAEPLQPDRPGGGDAAGGGSDDHADPSASKEKQQSDAALENVRDGYD